MNNSPASPLPRKPLPYFQLQDVSKRYAVRGGIFRQGNSFNALEKINLRLDPGKSCGIVGESGSGKTTLARLLSSLDRPTSGTLYFKGRPLPEVLQHGRKTFRREVQIIFQNPYTSLDPKWTIRKIIEEGISELSQKKRRYLTERVSEKTGLSHCLLDRRPSQLSGGERQRVAIARALILNPEFLILDEPTASLDVTSQWEIIRLLKALKPELLGGLLLITHDLQIASHLCEYLFVFHAGKLIEQGQKNSILQSPKSDYTRTLIQALPSVPGDSKIP